MTTKKINEKIKEIEDNLIHAIDFMNNLYTHLINEEGEHIYAARMLANQAEKELKKLKKSIAKNIFLYL